MPYIIGGFSGASEITHIDIASGGYLGFAGYSCDSAILTISSGLC